MKTKEEIYALRKNPKYYRLGGSVYYCPEDPYVVLPKKIPWMGWTFNFAHSKAWPTLLLLMGIYLIPALLILRYCQGNCGCFLLGILGTLPFLCFWAHYESTKYHRK